MSRKGSLKKRYARIFEEKRKEVVDEFMEHLHESMKAEKAAGFFSCKVTLEVAFPAAYKSRIDSRIDAIVPKVKHEWDIDEDTKKSYCIIHWEKE